MGGGPQENKKETETNPNPEELPPSTGEPKKRPVNTSNNIYKLYKCVAIKEKIGYFTWLFLSGAIFTLTSLSQMYSSDC
jgi:hypothetical protein